MNEKEKMINGYLYDALDETLDRDRINAQELYFRLNQMPPSREGERQKIIKQLLGKTGKQFTIRSTFYCDYGYNIEIGENFYANHNLVILDCAKVTFGDNVFIAPNCGFYTAGHPIDAQERASGIEFAYPIKVGNNVWIGANVSVLPNVTIGDNTVIGAGSVVNKDIPSNVVAAGNPCRVIRKITQADKGKFKKFKG